MDKAEQKAIKKALRDKEREAFLESLPIDRNELESLFGYLDEELEKRECDNKLSLTETYCAMHSLDFPVLKVWLEKNGGYCDCEVMFNVTDKLEW